MRKQLISLVNTAIVRTGSRASNMVLFPHITTTPVLFCCPLVAISAHSSITRFIKGSKPHNIPWTCLPPFNFSDNFSINFFHSGGWALLMMSTRWAQRCLLFYCLFKIRMKDQSLCSCPAVFRSLWIWLVVLREAWGWPSMTKLWNKTGNQQFRPWSPGSRAELPRWYMGNGLHMAETLIPLPSGWRLSAHGLGPVAPHAIEILSFSMSAMTWERLGSSALGVQGAQSYVFDPSIVFHSVSA